MKQHYDFTDAQQGKLYRPAKTLRIPVYLDNDVQRKLVAKDKRNGKDLSKLVNSLLRSQLSAAGSMK